MFLADIATCSFLYAKFSLLVLHFRKEVADFEHLGSFKKDSEHLSNFKTVKPSFMQKLE